MSKLSNIDEMDKCLETHSVPRLSHEELENIKTYSFITLR